ncbi:MAG: hypothetical protein DCF32_22360, partial [Leptolyngbya sp.]
CKTQPLLFHRLASTRLFYPRGGAEKLSNSEFTIAVKQEQAALDAEIQAVIEKAKRNIQQKANRQWGAALTS